MQLASNFMPQYGQWEEAEEGYISANHNYIL